MALSISEANTVQSKYYDKTLTQQVYEKSPLFFRLKNRKKVVWDGGSQIQFGIRYTTLGQAEAVNPREQITYEQKETRTAGVLDWKYYVAKTMIQWDERVKNTGKAQVINLLADKNTELREDMFNKFQSDLYATSQASKSFSSLDTIIDSSTSYAGISTSDADEWAAIEDSSTTRISLYGSGSLSYMINQATFGADKPNVIFTTRDLFSKVESLIQPLERIEDKEMADAGFNTVKFHGIPIVSDYACPSGYMFGIDDKYFEFRYHPEFNFKSDPWSDLKQAGFPNAMIKIVTWAGNLVCKMRKVNFKYSALDYTE